LRPKLWLSGSWRVDMEVGKFYIFTLEDESMVVWSEKSFDRTLEATQFIKEKGEPGVDYFVLRLTAGPVSVELVEHRKLVTQ
jgi:hypothetical protein